MTTPNENTRPCIRPQTEYTIVEQPTRADSGTRMTRAPRRVPNFAFTASELLQVESHVQAAEDVGYHAVTALAAIVGVSDDGHVLTLADASTVKGWF